MTYEVPVGTHRTNWKVTLYHFKSISYIVCIPNNSYIAAGKVRGQRINLELVFIKTVIKNIQSNHCIQNKFEFKNLHKDFKLNFIKKKVVKRKL
jgi:hypothetical protein